MASLFPGRDPPRGSSMVRTVLDLVPYMTCHLIHSDLSTTNGGMNIDACPSKNVGTSTDSDATHGVMSSRIFSSRSWTALGAAVWPFSKKFARCPKTSSNRPEFFVVRALVTKKQNMACQATYLGQK